ncbi:pantetheine-phosphate adenylyltransferase [Actinoplanes rectilineatus]|uniref:pantetheine-phosphate adenylyltransferase n=1 Tax=Actinoplanes rectilineatus TaxID=113571 RepID=UPI0005F2E6F6|nr:pantetheine-phosphate adenylyltransferase [Actinoplanes rectilineatus]
MPHTPARAVYPGTFDPLTPGHLDIVDRARHLFDHVTVLVAVNAGKQPSQPTATRATRIAQQIPAGWTNVSVTAWHGLTADYCHRHACRVIVRGVRNTTDYQHEHDLATTNEALGITTLLLPARPQLAATSSTAARGGPFIRFIH